MIDWRHWHNEPYLVGGLVFFGWLYALLAGPLRARLLQRSGLTPELAAAAPFPRAKAVKFYLSLTIFYLAVGSPLDQIGERFLFSAHMFQHQLLIYPSAILFLLGIPAWMIDPVLGAPSLHRLLRLISAPLSCGLIYTLVISLWHAPLAYDWALQNKVVHVAEHLMFFGAALFYWWPLLSPSRALPPIPHGARMIYLLGVLVAMTPIFAYITFSETILYPTYEFAPRLLANFSATDDQLIAGVGMKIVGMGVALTTFGINFYRWHQASEQKNSDRRGR
jgi:putative membrane protein